jgi:hypothetical protein
MLFILMTAIAVSCLRSDSGVVESLALRYRMYSNLFVVFSYIFTIENLLPQLKRESFRSGILAGVGILSVAFCVLSDVAGANYLSTKKQVLMYVYRVEWMRDPSAVDDAEVKEKVLAYIHKERHVSPGVFGMYEIDLPTLQESVHLGLYQPPEVKPGP